MAVVVDVGVDTGHRCVIAPRVGPGALGLLIPGRGLLPLVLAREAGVVRPREGLGLEPGHVDHRSAGVERGMLAEAPLRAEILAPAGRFRDVVLLLPRPALVRPPLAPDVAAALDEPQVAGV